jgi:hypothetical protein
MGAEGWIKLHRRLVEWEWYKVPSMVHLFLHLVLSANHEDGRWQGVVVKRGQLITGRRSLSEATGISEKTVRTCLSRLEETGEIIKKTASKFSIITVCKYSEYQEVACDEGPAKGQQRASKGPARGHKQECKNEKNEKKKDIGGQARFNPLKVRPEWITEKQWAELIDHRRRHPKKPVQSAKAYESLTKQLEIARRGGWSFDEILEKITNRSWAGFEAEWMGQRNGHGQNSTSRPESQKAKDARELVEALRRAPDGQSDIKTIAN